MPPNYALIRFVRLFSRSVSVHGMRLCMPTLTRNPFRTRNGSHCIRCHDPKLGSATTPAFYTGCVAHESAFQIGTRLLNESLKDWFAWGTPPKRGDGCHPPFAVSRQFIGHAQSFCPAIELSKIVVRAGPARWQEYQCLMRRAACQRVCWRASRLLTSGGNLPRVGYSSQRGCKKSRGDLGWRYAGNLPPNQKEGGARIRTPFYCGVTRSQGP